MIDFLLSTGIRVGELVRLNIDDIDFSERECVVYGKGDKERKAYFDAKTKIHLMNYISSEGLWQPERLRKACRLNRCRKYLGMSKLIQLSDMLW